MPDFKIVLKGLTLKEAGQLIEQLETMDEVEDARMVFKTHDAAFNPDNSQIMALLKPIEIAIHLAGDGAKVMGKGIALAAGIHLYKKIGEGLADKVWEYMSGKLSGKSVVEAEAVLYGPDDKPLKTMKRNR